MASPPRLSINPVRLASRWMMTSSGLFEPHLAGAGGTRHRAVAHLAVGAGKIGEVFQPVDFAGGIDSRGADAANSEVA